PRVLVGRALLRLTSRSRRPLRPTALHFLVVGLVFLCCFGLVILPEMGLVEAMGRDSTLTGRTDIWKEVLSTDVDPWLGTGFESFWLGKRAEQLWKKYYWHPNQAHNGYIEIFINLGWAGVACTASSWPGDTGTSPVPCAGILGKVGSDWRILSLRRSTT